MQIKPSFLWSFVRFIMMRERRVLISKRGVSCEPLGPTGRERHRIRAAQKSVRSGADYRSTFFSAIGGKGISLSYHKDILFLYLQYTSFACVHI